MDVDTPDALFVEFDFHVVMIWLQNYWDHTSTFWRFEKKRVKTRIVGV
jgi:hypothetical protein